MLWVWCVCIYFERDCSKAVFLSTLNFSVQQSYWFFYADFVSYFTEFIYQLEWFFHKVFNFSYIYNHCKQGRCGVFPSTCIHLIFLSRQMALARTSNIVFNKSSETTHFLFFILEEMFSVCVIHNNAGYGLVIYTIQFTIMLFFLFHEMLFLHLHEFKIFFILFMWNIHLFTKLQMLQMFKIANVEHPCLPEMKSTWS